jgi:hypothetical protein
MVTLEGCLKQTVHFHGKKQIKKTFFLNSCY